MKTGLPFPLPDLHSINFDKHFPPPFIRSKALAVWRASLDNLRNKGGRKLEIIYKQSVINFLTNYIYIATSVCYIPVIHVSD